MINDTPIKLVDGKTLIHFEGSDCIFYADDFCAHVLERLLACGAGQSDNTEAVVDFISSPDIEIIVTEEDAKKYLRPYGAWEESELANHNRNIERLIWQLGCQLRESADEPCTCGYEECECAIEAHFSTY